MSRAAAQRAATLYSLLRPAAQHGASPLLYLTDVPQRLATGRDPNRLDKLLPDHWQEGRDPP